MTNSEILRMVEDRIDSLRQVREDLINLQNDNPQVFEQYAMLTEHYNNAWDEVKNLLKSVEADDRIVAGPFSRDLKTYTTKYRPAMLPINVLGTPGVVKTVDDKKIVELLAQGVIQQSDVESARYEYAKTPSVRTNLKRAEMPTLGDLVK